MTEKKNTTILIVDDEPAIRESVAYMLKQNGFLPVEAPTLSAARPLIQSAALIILDLMLPDGSGLDFLSEIKKISAIPVILLTSRDEEIERVVGLEMGADDYITKPFSPREVAARVRAVLRRTNDAHEKIATKILTGPMGITMDLSYRKVVRDDKHIHLSKIEFDLLAVFLKSPQKVFARETLLTRVWGPLCHVSDRTVDAHLKSLRKKLKTSGVQWDIIETVRGVGYRLRSTS